MKEDFVYVKLDVDIVSHPKAARAGAAAVGVYCISLAMCRLHQTNGRLLKEAAFGILGGAGESAYAALTDPKVGWWVDHGDEIEVWNYAKKNQTREQIVEAKTAARGRAAASRERKDSERALHVHRTDGEPAPQVPGSGSGSSERDYDPGRDAGVQRGADPDRTPAGDESGVHRTARVPDPMGEAEIGERWRDGVAAGARGERPAKPMGGELRKLVELVYDRVAPGGGIEGQRARAAWALEYGQKFGEVFRDQTRNVHRFVDWVGSGCLAPCGRAGPALLQPLAPARARSEFTAADAIAEGERQSREGVI